MPPGFGGWGGTPGAGGGAVNGFGMPSSGGVNGFGMPTSGVSGNPIGVPGAPGGAQPDYHGTFRGAGQQGFRNLGNQLDAFRDKLLGGPSAVDAQYKSALAQGLADQQAMAATARPGDEALMARQMMQNGGNLGAQLGQAAMQQRMLEDEQRKQLWVQSLLGQRGQDVAAGSSAKDPNFFDYAMGIGSAVLPLAFGHGRGAGGGAGDGGLMR